MNTNTNQHDADIIVVGGGIIGGTFACLLGRRGLNVLLLDSGMRQVNELKTKDPRVFAITLASSQILKQAGAWQGLSNDDIACFRKMHVWDENGLGEINFDSASVCQNTMGYIISHQSIVDALQAELIRLDNVRCIWSVSPRLINRDTDSITVVTEDELSFKGKLLVAADGSRSKVRGLAGIEYNRHDYKQSALACIVSTQFAHAEVARQRFLKGGPLAFLPMKQENQSAIVWSTSPEHVQRLKDMDQGRFHFELAEAFAYELGEITTSSERVSFPLQRAQAEQYTQNRLALIGDSAHVVHPLAGLGANLGLLDAASLAEILITTHNRGRDIGRSQVLRRYERWRKGENKNMMYIMDGFKHLFENQMQSVQWLRNFGLDVVDGLPFLKDKIMKRAMGLEGDLPVFARQ